MAEAFEVVGTDAAPAPRTVLRAKHIAGVTAGNALEFYDFLTYAFFAAQIGRTFFPSTTPSASLLASLATFGAGFLMRPVGALVLGRMADRVGRKPAMLISFTIMGLAMTGLALTPSHAMIGMAAPILAIVFRLLQGFALGGEIGPNTAYLAEAAPPRRRALIVSLQFLSQNIAVTVAGLVGYFLSSVLTDAELDAWGWRAAFLLGSIIVPFGLVMRRQLVESLPEHGDLPKPTPAERSRFARVIALGVVVLAGGTIVSYTMNYLTTYATQTLHMPTNVGFLGTVFVGVFSIIGDPIGGVLSDRYGRKPLMIIFWVILLLVTLPGFLLLAHYRSTWALMALTSMVCLSAEISQVSTITSITEGIPTHVRAGALGLVYAFAISVFGGSTQFVVTWLMDLTKNPLTPAFYMTGAVAIALVAICLLPETAPVKARRPAE